MTSFTRASLVTGWAVLVNVLLSSKLVSAQHPVVPPPHPTAAPVHVYTPPIYHAPVVSTPIMRPPVLYAPISAPFRSASSPGAVRRAIVLPPVHPIRPIRPVLPVIIFYTPPFLFGEPFWGFNSCWDANCNWFWPLSIGYTNISSPGPTNYVLQASEAPIYVYGDEREDRPQLYLEDGTILNVTDYWVVDNQLHFKVVAETGTKPVEQAIPFEELDLQKTIDANTQRGFRFLLRNEPFEKYVRDHPEGPPPLAVPPQQ